MNLRDDQEALSTTRFGIGQPVPRNEDPVLVSGKGRYTDDIDIDGQLYAVMVRSPHGHGLLQAIDAEAARAMPGVVAVYTGADLESYGLLRCRLPFKNRDGSEMNKPPRRALAMDKVRFVGDPVAFVVAETAAAAQDAAEAVMLDIEPLLAVSDARAAAAPDAPQLYDDAPGNVALDYHFGDSAKVEAGFAAAAHVTKLRIVNNRIIINPMEPRAALAKYDAAEERFTLHAPSQGVFGMRASVAEVLKVPVEKVHLLTDNVGGSFGMKSSVFPEYVCVLHAARDLGRPVKWTDKRSESFMSDYHGRDHDFDVELALDAQGHFLAIRVNGFGNMGGYLSPMGPMMATLNIAKNMVSVYRTPAIEVNTRCVFTNTSPIAAYRGAGRPEGNYYMERLVDNAAREMNIDRIELRRRNHIAPEQMPYATPVGTNYDSGEFGALLDSALDFADWENYPVRKADSARRGKLRGIGVGQYLEVTAPPGGEYGGIHFEADGSVTLVTGTLDYGQGHWTPFAQVLSEKLGVPFEAIRLVQGDSDRLLAGGGTGGSKSIMASGSAIIGASEKVIAKGKLAASHMLEAAVDDIAFEAGRFTIVGTDRSIDVMELARRVAQASDLPQDCPTTLDVDHIHGELPATYPNGCHIVEVEIDPDTGITEVVKYSMVNDFGVVVNPLLVEGQLHGGVAQGIGQCLMERTFYDEEGQLASGSYMDYALPRALEMPPFEMASRPVPARTNPLGAKGCGEAGCAGSLTSIMNAMVDALSVYGITHIDMPATPHLVWQAIQAARLRNG